MTGLPLGEETELELGDLIICGSSGIDFSKFTSISTMKTLVQGSEEVKLFRKYDTKKAHEKIRKEGKMLKHANNCNLYFKY